MKVEIYHTDDTWARVRFIGDTDYLLGVLAPSRADSLVQIISAAKLAGWTIVYPPGGEDTEIAENEPARLYRIIEDQAELIRKFEIDNRQLEHLLRDYKKMVEDT
jgi:hypothetical protein